MFESNCILKDKDLGVQFAACDQRLQTVRNVGYRSFRLRGHSNLLHNLWRGFSSINLVGRGHYAKFDGYFLSQEEAIADDWHMIGNDLCYAIVTFDRDHHGRLTAEHPRKSESAFAGAWPKSR